MKNILHILIVIASSLLSLQSLSGQSKEIDTIEAEPSIAQQLLKITGDIKSHTKDIDEIRMKAFNAGYLITEAARLQNQSRAVLFFGTAIGGLVFAGTGNITVFSVVVGGASLIALIDAIDSSVKLKKAGTTLIELNYN
jgi:hypothetical protein